MDLVTFHSLYTSRSCSVALNHHVTPNELASLLEATLLTSLSLSTRVYFNEQIISLAEVVSSFSSSFCSHAFLLDNCEETYKIVQIQNENHLEMLESFVEACKKYVLVLFCYQVESEPCRELYPFYVKLAEETKVEKENVIFAAFCLEMNVEAVPTLRCVNAETTSDLIGPTPLELLHCIRNLDEFFEEVQEEESILSEDEMDSHLDAVLDEMHLFLSNVLTTEEYDTLLDLVDTNDIALLDLYLLNGYTSNNQAFIEQLVLLCDDSNWNFSKFIKTMSDVSVISSDCCHFFTEILTNQIYQSCELIDALVESYDMFHASLKITPLISFLQTTFARFSNLTINLEDIEGTLLSYCDFLGICYEEVAYDETLMGIFGASVFGDLPAMEVIESLAILVQERQNSLPPDESSDTIAVTGESVGPFNSTMWSVYEEIYMKSMTEFHIILIQISLSNLMRDQLDKGKISSISYNGLQKLIKSRDIPLYAAFEVLLESKCTPSAFVEFHDTLNHCLNINRSMEYYPTSEVHSTIVRVANECGISLLDMLLLTSCLYSGESLLSSIDLYKCGAIDKAEMLDTWFKCIQSCYEGRDELSDFMIIRYAFHAQDELVPSLFEKYQLEDMEIHAALCEFKISRNLEVFKQTLSEL